MNYGPKTITNGLVLYLDAANTKSYPGSGTTWYDLSGNSNNGTLTNGPTFSSSNMGIIVMDGADDFVSFSVSGLSSVATIDMWAKIKNDSEMIFGWNKYDVYFTNGFGYNTFNAGDVYGISTATATSLGIINNWKHYIFEMRSDVSYINNKIYINGISQSLSQQLSSEDASNRTFNSGNGYIARTGGLNNSTQMDCAMFKIYNRILTPTEILQDYNATKRRFGL